ncbi:hypothetical protein CLOSTMETH_01276 [[Clostridium] methylpentosum DSM 5476]|uniref:Uncharacterized protein n=1 Tax=[Clostridium] methylpentosum DSM 5476 TaxID=537013 RepID=C0EBQ8_9FIRM|nr:hypothetical protein CLOSTMETH_01276 [[Clostridium] methylpentosum DSM 5476]
MPKLAATQVDHCAFCVKTDTCCFSAPTPHYAQFSQIKFAKRYMQNA